MASKDQAADDRRAELDRLKQERWGKAEELEKERGDKK